MPMVMSSAVAVEPREQPDEELIQQVLSGNTALFELLMRRYNERGRAAAIAWHGYAHGAQCPCDSP